MMKRRPIRMAAMAAALVYLSAQALATWSIVAIRHSTGEVCVASATCVPGTPLHKVLAVVSVGKGGAAAQSAPDTDGTNRQLIWDGLQAGWTPEEIMDALTTVGSAPATRQYGVAAFTGPAATFTGGGAGQAKEGVAGDIDGDIFYAIQGNVLAGEEVILASELAMRGTQGDLGQKVMAAMEAASYFGGDGRCSCAPFAAASCGSPPPPFEKASDVAFIIVARMGDTEGECNLNAGCASGEYYLFRKFYGGPSDPDPVIKLRERYDVWRSNRIGRVDHVLSEVSSAVPRLVADGVTSTEVTVKLRDIDGAALTSGGQFLTITPVNAGAPVATAGPVTDNGDGTHTFTLTATTDSGTGEWQIVVQDGNQFVQLFPDLTVDVDPLAELHTGFLAVSASAGASVPFVVNRGGVDAGRPYQILGSASGTSPGQPWTGGLTIPLNDDRLFNMTLNFPGPPRFPGSEGVLDMGGRAEASLEMPPEALAPFAGGHFDFLAVLSGAPDEFTNLVGIDVSP